MTVLSAQTWGVCTPVNTYVEHANLSPLALGPLSSYNTSALPITPAAPLRGRCGSVNRRRVSFSPFAFLPAILSMPWRADRSPSRQNPGWDRLHKESVSLGSNVTWKKRIVFWNCLVPIKSILTYDNAFHILKLILTMSEKVTSKILNSIWQLFIYLNIANWCEDYPVFSLSVHLF